LENKTFFIWFLICVFTHSIRTTYEILKYHNKIKPNKLTFTVIFINMGLLWTSWFILCSVDLYKINLPDLVRYFGLFLFITGIVIFFISLFTIKTLESYKGDLITKGIYSKIRHPMYLSFILWLIGFSIFNEAFISFIFSFLLISNILYWRYLEEKELEKRYSAYKDYKKRTLF